MLPESVQSSDLQCNVKARLADTNAVGIIFSDSVNQKKKEIVVYFRILLVVFKVVAAPGESNRDSSCMNE